VPTENDIYQCVSTIHSCQTHTHTVTPWPSEHTQLSGDSFTHGFKGHDRRLESQYCEWDIQDAELAEGKGGRAVRDERC